MWVSRVKSVHKGVAEMSLNAIQILKFLIIVGCVYGPLAYK